MLDRIREYEFLDSLGKGGMGEVFKARHVLRDRLFAVKVIRKELGADPQHRQRFLREARILLDLDHPAIVRSLDVFEEQERLYLVMELLEGEPLSALLARSTPRFAAGRLLLTPIMEAVAHAHRLGIVHRDLKPANVFILKDGSVKVLDFGLAKELGDASVTTTGQGLGTPAYMAPEVFTGERKIAEIGPEGDVYALGVIAYRLFTGRMPFNLPEDTSSLEAVAHLTRHYVLGKQAPDIAALCPEMPKPFAQAVMAALVVNPEARLKDAGEMLRALLDWQEKGVQEPSRKFTVSGAAAGKVADTEASSEDNTIIHSLPKFNPVAKDAGKANSVEQAADANRRAGAAVNLPDAGLLIKSKGKRRWLLGLLAVFIAAGLIAFAAVHLRSTPVAGVKAYRSGDYQTAFRELSPLAEKGDPIAQYYTGLMYDKGMGAEKNETEALKWFRKAAPGLRRAAEKGNTEAQWRLGVMYNNGYGVAKDYAEALKWYRKAADQGNAFGQVTLGLMYNNGDGVAEDYAEAVKWYRKAADQGNAFGQFNLGTMYEDGNGVAKDCAEAVKWYRKAADQGYARGQYHLGRMYANGYGVTKDYAEAVKWYRKAADQGDADGQSNLGVMYINGYGVAEDHAEALKWFRKAADQGNASGHSHLGSMYYGGYGVAKDYAEAVKWYRKAADQGDADGQYYLGDMYENGKGVPKDRKEARNWYEKAASQDNKDAKAALKRFGK